MLVIKKDGHKELFDFEKLKKSIAAAAQDAGLSSERVSELVTEVSASVFQLISRYEEVQSTEIREKVLEELNKVEPSVTEAWEKYEKSFSGLG